MSAAPLAACGRRPRMTPLQPCPSQDPAAIDRWSGWQEWPRNAYSWRPVHRDGLEIGNRATLAETLGISRITYRRQGALHPAVQRRSRCRLTAHAWYSAPRSVRHVSRVPRVSRDFRRYLTLSMYRTHTSRLTANSRRDAGGAPLLLAWYQVRVCERRSRSFHF